MNDTQIVILVGGKGTRLHPITTKIPKPMVEINGIPFLEILINMLKQKGFSKFLFLAGYLNHLILEHFGNGQKFDCTIQYSIEKRLLGTAGALKQAEKLLESEFILLNGDTFLDLDYVDLVNSAKYFDKICTMVCYHDISSNNLQNNLQLSHSNLLLNYSKYDLKAEFNAIDSGVYYVKKEILNSIPNGYWELEKNVFQDLIENNQLAGYLTTTRFYDIGTFQILNIFQNYTKSKN